MLLIEMESSCPSFKLSSSKMSSAQALPHPGMELATQGIFDMSPSIHLAWIYTVWAILNNWCGWLDQVDLQVTCCDCFWFAKLKLQYLQLNILVK